MLQRYLLMPATSLIFAIISSVATATEISEENLQTIATLNYRGIGFTSSQQDVLQVLPKANLNNKHLGSKIGISTYEVRDDTANDCVLLRFFDDELVEIDYISFPNRIAGKGGTDAMTSKAIKRFGPPTKQNGDTLFWDFQTINRIVVVSRENRKWSLHIYHRDRRLGIPLYKDTTVDVRESWMQVSVGPTIPHKSMATSSDTTQSKTTKSIAGKRLSKYEVNARDFGYGNIKIGIDSSALGFRYNQALGDQREARRHGDHLHFGGRLPADMGIVTYVVEQGKDRRLLVGCQYGNLVSITSIRGNLKLSRVVSLENDQSKATKKFGPDIYLKDGRNLTWHFKAVNRKVDYRVFDAKDRTQIVSLRVSLLHLNLP
jgi:hypothetical protein